MVLAAADPVGDATLLWRAAATLGLERQAAEPAAGEQLLEIGAQVRFRHPLVRSAAYRAGDLGGPTRRSRRARRRIPILRRIPTVEPGIARMRRSRRTRRWPGVDRFREPCATPRRHRRRRRVAGASGDVHARPWRAGVAALTAAQMKLEAGDLSAAGSLLAAADAGPLDELGQAGRSACTPRLPLTCDVAPTPRHCSCARPSGSSHSMPSWHGRRISRRWWQ